MSEMTQAQVPPDGDEDPDPSTEMVPPAARSTRDPSSSAESFRSGLEGGADTGAEDEIQQSDKSSRPAVVLPTEEDMPTTTEEDMGEAGGSEAEGPSDPMPDMAGGEARPTP
jgi:hypothetical protein